MCFFVKLSLQSGLGLMKNCKHERPRELDCTYVVPKNVTPKLGVAQQACLWILLSLRDCGMTRVYAAVRLRYDEGVRCSATAV